MRKQVPVMLSFARYLIYPNMHVCLHVILLTGAYLCLNKTPHILQKNTCISKKFKSKSGTTEFTKLHG